MISGSNNKRLTNMGTTSFVHASQLLVVATSDSAAALVSCRNTNSGPQTILAVVWGPDTTDQRMIPGGSKDKRLKFSGMVPAIILGLT